MVPIIVFLFLLFGFGLVSHVVERSIITGPMLFTAAGILLVFVLPDQVPANVKLKPVVLFSEMALSIVLFTDASRIKIRALIASPGLPARLLAFGMPLTILLGTLVALVLLADLKLWEAAIVATILAPTDAGLGQVVVNSPRVPIRIRQALNVEAGLNDGISLPFLMLFIALARVNQPLQQPSWIDYAARQIGFGLLLGLAFGYVGGWLMGRATQRKWMTGEFLQLGLLSLALLSWGATDLIGGNGFIAAFLSGLVVTVGFQEAGKKMVEFSEAWGQLLSFGMFFLFGMLAAPVLSQFNTAVILYALLSLTLVRLLPVAVALLGTRLQPASVLFLGWFGPRGLASIVLGLLFLKEEADLPGEPLIEMVVVATVLLSVFAHGITAASAIDRYAQRVEALDADAPERVQAVPAPTRRAI